MRRCSYRSNLAISPNEEHLVCSLENHQVYTLLLSNQEIMKQDEMNFEVRPRQRAAQIPSLLCVMFRCRTTVLA